MNIVNSVLPSFVPSYTVSIPTGQPFPNIDPNANANSNAQTYYTSVISTNGNPILTFQARYADYYGNVLIEGSTIADGDWYPISLHTGYSNVTDTKGYTIQGFHPYFRMQFVSNVCIFSDVLVR